MSKTLRQTDFYKKEMGGGGLELPFWLRWVCAPTLAGDSAKTLIFSADGGKYGSSRTSIHHVEKEKEMGGCPSLFLGPSGET